VQGAPPVGWRSWTVADPAVVLPGLAEHFPEAWSCLYSGSAMVTTGLHHG
jgi:hypothetical protein